MQQDSEDQEDTSRKDRSQSIFICRWYNVVIHKIFTMENATADKDFQQSRRIKY